MDKTADKLCELVLKNGLEDWRTTLQKAGKELAGKYDLRHVRWVLQDSLHRAVIQNAGENILDQMFIDEQEQW